MENIKCEEFLSGSFEMNGVNMNLMRVYMVEGGHDIMVEYNSDESGEVFVSKLNELEESVSEYVLVKLEEVTGIDFRVRCA